MTDKDVGTATNDFDSPWKEALSLLFQDFLALLFPQVHDGIDWQQPVTFLDTELQKIVRDAGSGKKRVDKLVQVYTKEHTETWLLIHIEIQGRASVRFNQRMFRYFYRLQDAYPDREIVNLAVLTHQQLTHKLGRYQQQRWGSGISFQYPLVCLQDWADKEEELLHSDNPFACVVLAQLIAHRTRPNEQRMVEKAALMRRLLRSGYSTERVYELLRFIDWLLHLPETLSVQLMNRINPYEDDTMRYVAHFERVPYNKGLDEGIHQGVEATLRKQITLKFGALPDWAEERLHAASDEQLDRWVTHILSAESLEQLLSS
ncbi:hypothetical protein [Nitrincola alkalilacustris]|uniref:hypothetical protein n=1 Tax=Nitrincola alkalilacustris TaxID=1571224 RepID=UPI00124E3565|nr:hypothetical protein [Nitrincola alkalilacustris]